MSSDNPRIDRPTTIRDLANATGLSVSTISNYLNGKPVRRENRPLIEDAIRTLGYTRNETAREVRLGCSDIVGIVVSNLNIDYVRQVALLLQENLENNGYTPVIYDCRSDAAIEQRTVERIVRRNVSGIISLPTDPDSVSYHHAAERRLPLVLLSSSDSSVSASHVTISDEYALGQMFTALLEAGHKRIGVIAAAVEFELMQKRTDVFCKLLHACFPDSDRSLLYTDDRISVNVGYTGALRLMAAPVPPTAIVCLSRDIFIGARLALCEHGFCIPEQVSLCGIELDYNMNSDMTMDYDVILQPVQLLAQRATDFLCEAIQMRSGDAPLNQQNLEILAKYRSGHSIAPPFKGKPV